MNEFEALKKSKARPRYSERTTKGGKVLYDGIGYVLFRYNGSTREAYPYEYKFFDDWFVGKDKYNVQ